MDTLRTYFFDTLRYRYDDFNGRSRRREYWYFVLYSFLSIVIAGSISRKLGDFKIPIFSTFIKSFHVIVFFVLLVPYLAISVRRLHDINKSGWYLLIYFIPFGSLILFYFFCCEGVDNENEWGLDPKGEVEDWEL